MTDTRTHDVGSVRALRTMGRAQELKQLESGYLERERSWKNESGKTEQRRMLAEFFLSHHAPDEQFRLLSLPSLHWTFERQLVEMCPGRRFFFVGLERAWGIIEMGRPYMPGGRSERFSVSMKIGSIEGLHTFQDGVSSHWLWTDAASFLNLESRDKKKRERSRFAHVYKRNTAIWLDFTSQFCPEVKRALSRAGQYVRFDRPITPFAVTVMAARDEFSSDRDRERAIVLALNESRYRQFKMTRSFRYVHHDIPMLTVIGVFINHVVMSALSNERLIELHCEELSTESRRRLVTLRPVCD